MSAFGHGDPRTEIHDWLRDVQRTHELTDEQLIAAALAALVAITGTYN